MTESELHDRIGDIFYGRTVLITGGTGFVAKALLEKILRVTNIKKVYLLIRKKKGKSPGERLQEIFNNVLFTKLNEQKPKAIKKCSVILGDVAEEDLGVSKEDREILRNEVEFIFHSAATTRFDDTLRTAITINTRGTKLMLDLAVQCKELKLFIHVSTAYVFPNEDTTLEKEYQPPADPYDVLHSINWIKEESMGNLSRSLLGDLPNSYTFSKALAEALVYDKVSEIPVIITRPAVVIPTYSDPFPGWFNNMQGPMGLFVGGGKGVIRSVYMDSKSLANIVPVDSAVNVILVASWFYLSTKNPPYIFNVCVPAGDITISWADVLRTGQRVVNDIVPFNGVLWYPGGSITRSKLYHKINCVLFQLLPALIIDFLLIVLCYKPVLCNIQMRILKGEEMFQFYTTKKWDFETKNLEYIRTKLNAKEREVYPLQIDGIDVQRYLTDCILNARRNILRETDDMLPAARRNMKIMYVLDKLVKILFVLVVTYYLSTALLPPSLKIL